ncbi:MAG: hypothetical protein WD342_00020 [Verrucomicrobiales bacterium]
MAKPKTVTREELYEEVWQIPGRKLAKRYGVSDVALAKICRKMNVPRPYRGYWSRIQAGQHPKRTPLPRAKADIHTHEFTRRDSTATLSRVRNPEKKQAEFRNPIVVPSRLTKLHPLLEASRTELERGDRNFYWDPMSYMRRHFSVSVHPKARPRAFRIVNAFLEAIEARGYEVRIASCYHGGGCAVIFGQEIRFDVRDWNCSLPDDGKPGSKPFAWSWEDGSAKTRKGLVFRVYRSWNNGCGTSHWRDGKRQRLEDLLDRILLQMVQLARKDRNYEIQKEKREREQEEQERIRLQHEAKVAAEKERRRELVEAAESWKRSALLREFIAAMEAKLGQDCAEGREILTWARDVADDMDPLVAHMGELLHRLSEAAD